MAEAEILPSGEFGVAVLAQEETTTEEQVAIAGTETTHNDEDNNSSNNNDEGAATPASVNLSNDSMDPPAPNLTKESPPRTSPTKHQQEHQSASSLDNPNESSDEPLPSPEKFVNNGAWVKNIVARTNIISLLATQHIHSCRFGDDFYSPNIPRICTFLFVRFQTLSVSTVFSKSQDWNDGRSLETSGAVGRPMAAIICQTKNISRPFRSMSTGSLTFSLIRDGGVEPRRPLPWREENWHSNHQGFRPMFRCHKWLTCWQISGRRRDWMYRNDDDDKNSIITLVLLLQLLRANWWREHNKLCRLLWLSRMEILLGDDGTFIFQFNSNSDTWHIIIFSTNDT